MINVGKPLIFYEKDIKKMSAGQSESPPWSVCKVWAGAPLKIRDQSFGALVVQSYRSKDAFKKTDLELLNSVAEFIAVAIERKRAEAAVKESEARFRALIDHSYDAVFIHKSDGRLIDVNKTMLNMFKVSHDEAFLYNIADYIGPKSSRAEVQDNWLRALAGEDLLFPLQARRPKDGSLFDAEVYLTRIIFNGRRIILGNIRDITSRKKAEKALQVSEEKYRLLFENSVEGIYQTSPEGRFIAANPSFLRLFGFDSPQELFEHFNDIGKEQYLNSEDRVTFRKIAEAEGLVRGFETQLRKKDGTPIWVSLNSRAVKNDKGVLLYYEGFMQDITKRKKVEQELYQVSIHDHLTGIFNRRYVFERLDTMIKEYQRETRDFSLSIVDLNFFKKINDT
ncbi:MAG: PAS domain S-box protein, partial [Nitrospirota bacterium]|nr:PAS domain S-box protein [Nitrospirota bacterium]